MSKKRFKRSLYRIFSAICKRTSENHDVKDGMHISASNDSKLQRHQLMLFIVSPHRPTQRPKQQTITLHNLSRLAAVTSAKRSPRQARRSW